MPKTQTATERRFDLNVDRVLEHWGVSEALREVISNALDETDLRRCRAPEITQDSQGRWHVRDWGSGLRYQHLTQNENPEKIKRTNLLGKFGVGLKDALATFERNGIGVQILSPHQDIALGRSAKAEFADVITLHALINEASDPARKGTEFIFDGISDKDMASAKDYFLKFADERELDRNKDGAVLVRRGKAARIYVNGLRVASEDDFLFSYDITSMTAALRRALNRERSHVGRTAYQDRVKAILLRSESEEVMSRLADDIEEQVHGGGRQETRWLDVAVRACQILAGTGSVVFISPDDGQFNPGSIQKAVDDGRRVVMVPETILRRLSGQKDTQGRPMIDLGGFLIEWNQSFEFNWVEVDQLDEAEREVWAIVEPLLALVLPKRKHVKEIRISESMRVNPRTQAEAEGLWESLERRIIIKRSCLDSKAHLAGTLLHEIGHALSDAGDVSPEFEDALTKLLGSTGSVAVQTPPSA